jgi:predicted dehydrogenase
MKGLVIGGGSIGSRHLKNLSALGVDQLALVEPDEPRRTALANEVNAVGFSDMKAGFDWQPDFVVIATPSHLHDAAALMAARRGLDLFIEKPLAHTANHLDELSALVVQKNLISMVGCNIRFHPGPMAIKELLENGKLRKILFSRIQVGSYLPEWRPTQDYRRNYAAKAETGGGCILDCIHEIDLALWYLGPASRVFCHAAHVSSLEIETEDVASIILQHTSGATSEIHLDYVQRSYQRDCQIVGELGSIFWDFNDGNVRFYDAGDRKGTVLAQLENWSTNDMYVAEMKHFLSCIESRKQTTLPIPDGTDLMRLVFAAKLSAKTGQFIRTAEARACS